MKCISVGNRNWSLVPFVVGGKRFCISCDFASAVAERYGLNLREICARHYNLVYIWLIAPMLRPEMVAACATVLGGYRVQLRQNLAMGGRVGYHEISVWAVGWDLSFVGEVVPCNRGLVGLWRSSRGVGGRGNHSGRFCAGGVK